MLAGVAGPDEHEAPGCCPTVGGRKGCLWNPGDPLGYLLGFAVPSDDCKMGFCTTMAWKGLAEKSLGHFTRLAALTLRSAR